MDFDDGQTIFLDWNKVTEFELNNLNIGYFDVVNIPKRAYDNIDNYYITYVTCPKSSTGYIAMFLHKDRNIYKTRRFTRKDFK